MTGWRRFEFLAEGKRAYREIKQEGIRCFIRWGSVGGSGKASASTLNDEEHARRHAARKINELLRKGFIEVEPLRDDAELDQTSPVLDVIRAGSGAAGPVPEYLPVDGLDEVYCRTHSGHVMGFHEYVILREQGRSAVRFVVRGKSHEAGEASAFLDFVCARRDLAFDGRSHHKVPMPRPVRGFTHALFCAPSLGQAYRAYPAVASRVATVFPMFDCEIGDADPEVLVDARIHGHGALSYSDWSRDPQPVVDLRFDMEPSDYGRAKTFKVYRPTDFERLMAVLPDATPQSWLEARSFRGEIRRFTPDSAPSVAEGTSFLLG
ncbi:WGR domain-containing protein [Streptomyces sp. 12297]